MMVISHGQLAVANQLRRASIRHNSGRMDLALFEFNAACAMAREQGLDIYPEIKAEAARYRTKYLMRKRQ